MVKKKRNNNALKQVVSSKRKAEQTKHMERMFVQGGYVDNRRKINQIKEEMINATHKSFITPYPEMTKVFDILNQANDGLKSVRREILDCLVLGLNIDIEKVDSFTVALMLGVTFDESGALDVDLSFARNNLKDNPIFNEEDRAALNLLLSNFKYVCLYEYIQANKTEDKKYELLHFQDVVVSFLYYGTSHYFHEKPRHSILERVRDILGHTFVNQMISLYHSYSGYLDVEKLDTVLQKYEGMILNEKH